MTSDRPLIDLEHPPFAISQADTLSNKTGSWRYMRPFNEEKLPPCRNACPAGTDIPRVLTLLADGKPDQAFALIKEENPFPAVCGRVCYHPCELACNRRHFDQAASIQAVERFLADNCSATVRPARPTRHYRQRIAVVGSGPAGLSCAYFLAREGLQVTVFEAHDKPGGMLRQGIPAYRLPRPVLDQEIEQFLELGVKFQLQTRIGRDSDVSKLRKEFDGVFLATGAHLSRRILDQQGTLGGRLMPGLDFLKRTNQGEHIPIGQRVLVIGGGNTAIDAARTARRLGARVTIAYRRGRAEMPAIEDEFRQACAEGVKFAFQTAPVEVRSLDGRLRVRLLHTRPGPPDQSGRSTPIPVEGSEFEFDADTVLTAVGERGEYSDDQMAELMKLGVLVGGDLQTGPSTVTQAIAAGKRAARAILDGQGIRPQLGAMRRPDKVIGYSSLNCAYFRTVPRFSPPLLSVAERLQSFVEVVGPLSTRQAMAEAKRCFSCGVCNECGNCWTFCPEAAVSHSGHEYVVNLDYCKGCGLCAHECPRGVITLVQEEQ